MRVSLQWLKDYIDLPTEDPIELGRAFDMLGHAVESIDILDVDWTSVLIGKVLTVEAHPDADKVRVTTVDVGQDEPYQIICGAWTSKPGPLFPWLSPERCFPATSPSGRARSVESNRTG